MLVITMQNRIKELFEYKDGNLYWRNFQSPRAVAGSKAGSRQPNGYWRIGIDRVYYNLHRVIWMYHNGEIPDGMHIDHLNGNPSDNRVENLRLCTPQQNEWNKDRKAGVRFESGKWRARYSHNGQDKHIGMFDTKDEAEVAYWNTVKPIRDQYLRGMTQ
jgi:hypothetical protein